MRNTKTFEPLLRKIRFRKNFPAPEVRRHLRETAGLTQDDIARAIDVDRATVSRYESLPKLPKGPVLERYAQLLDTIKGELSAGNGGAQ